MMDAHHDVMDTVDVGLNPGTDLPPHRAPLPGWEYSLSFDPPPHFCLLNRTLPPTLFSLFQNSI